MGSGADPPQWPPGHQAQGFRIGSENPAGRPAARQEADAPFVKVGQVLVLLCAERLVMAVVLFG
jgi:hypothetical protein